MTKRKDIYDLLLTISEIYRNNYVRSLFDIVINSKKYYYDDYEFILYTYIKAESPVEDFKSMSSSHLIYYVVLNIFKNNYEIVSLFIEDSKLNSKIEKLCEVIDENKLKEYLNCIILDLALNTNDNSYIELNSDIWR